MNKQDKFLGEALSFDDVLLVPGYSEILPKTWIFPHQLGKRSS